MLTISQPLLTFLLNACWQIALITAIAAFCAWLLRGTAARYQHLLWVTALAFSFGLPVLTCAPLLGGAFFSEPPRTKGIRKSAQSTPMTAMPRRLSAGIIGPRRYRNGQASVGSRRAVSG